MGSYPRSLLNKFRDTKYHKNAPKRSTNLSRNSVYVIFVSFQAIVCRKVEVSHMCGAHELK